MEDNRQPETYSRLVQVEKEIAVVHSSVKSLDDHLKQTNQSLKELTEAFREHVLESMHRQENRIIIVEQDVKYFRAIIDEQRALIADMEKRQKEDDKALLILYCFVSLTAHSFDAGPLTAFWFLPAPGLPPVT